MSKKALLLSFALVAILATACSKKEKGSSDSISTSGAIGVAACDEYVTKVKKCIGEKVPAEAKAAFEQGMNSSVEQWKSAASNADAKAALETGCKAALDAMKASLASYNCEW